jgi:hypothetical protein
VKSEIHGTLKFLRAMEKSLRTEALLADEAKLVKISDTEDVYRLYYLFSEWRKQFSTTVPSLIGESKIGSVLELVSNQRKSL